MIETRMRVRHWCPICNGYVPIMYANDTANSKLCVNCGAMVDEYFYQVKMERK